MFKRRFSDPRVVVSVVYVASGFVAIMDSTIVNVALPTLHRYFASSGHAVDAVVVAYLVSMAVAIPAAGWAGDRFGAKPAFLSSLVVFWCASGLCGLSASLPELLVARVVQGMAAGVLLPTGTAMLYRTFPPEQRAEVARILVIPTVIAPAMGPVLGGWLVDQLSWRWVFFVNVPIGLVATLFGLLWLRDHREPAAGRFDLAGFLLASSGFGLVLYAMTEGPTLGSASPVILGSLLLGLCALGAFVRVELRAPEPMVQLGLLRDRLFRTANLVSLFGSAAFLGLLFMVPMFLQQALGYSALQSGLTSFPEAIGVILSSQVVARLYPRIGPRRLMAGGLLAVTLTVGSFSLLGLDVSPWLVRLLMFLTGCGMAYMFLPVQAAAFTAISPAATGRASALYNAQNQLGSALGVGALSSVLAALGPTLMGVGGVAQVNLAAYRASFLTAAALALVGAAVALRVPDRDAAASMRPRGTVPAELAAEEALPARQ